jgi:alpha,alpha-trehalase
VYYWDTYWVIRGLLVSGMHRTATGMVHNLLHQLKTFGLVPNGNRAYYLNRSQPPLLSEMVRSLTLRESATEREPRRNVG